MRIGIIGGGAAGLGAAYELTLRGHTAEIFEQAPFLGGQASTFEVGGQPLERGYHHLFRSDTAMADLMEELGLGHRLTWIDSSVGFFYDGKVWPFMSPLDLLRFKPLSLINRFRVGLVTLYLQRRKEWKSLEQSTAAEWMRRRAGEKGYQVVFEPMLRGKFGRFFDQVSMAWLWNKFALRTTSRGKGLKGMAKEQLGYPVGSFDEVFQAAAAYVVEKGGQVHTSAAVEEVVVEEGRATGLTVRINGGEPERQPYDAVIATVPSYIFPKLVPSLPEDYTAKLSSATYLAAVLVVLIMDRPLSPVYWMNIADRSLPFLAIIEHTNFMPPEHYGGKHIVYLANYLDDQDPLFHMGREELFAEYLPHLKKVNPEFDASWVEEYHYHREAAAQPVVTKGYSAQIPDSRTPISGLYLANTTQIYPEDRGTNYSVRLGRQVAGVVDEDQKR
jgi:protoporphyrinogen oxidase